ncbi:SDR family NAD(P)-dependent oxidoreductase [Acuticoccus sp. M5D2P5]|uniref:SDR family NAD(P)-dependent oxidoreductase n=1 Tax=Acuticoccus kalidii TaxID=2910977 RepID=UPI001F3D7DCA|nr:SDR family NAD(P)-dependent oxidoreductase [Acuticoccus kalidii]MCF3932249.1 SDR family NAD(P)-dependent oxidoreductase [Acuticoccus kalidii]
MLDPAGRVIMVSGANRGIGRAITEKLLSKGYRVSAGARDVAGLKDVLAPVANAHLLCAQYDAETRATYKAWVEATLTTFGRIDGLVNNAGTSNTFSIEDGDEADFDRLVTINLKGPLFMTRLVMPHLRKVGHGRIVNISSLSGKRVANANVAYAMTKHALMALTHSTRRIGWDDGVRATAVCPSFVATDLTADVTKVRREDMIDPADLAELVATAIALPNNAVMAEMLVNCKLEDLF